MVQMEGTALRISPAALRQAFNESEALRTRLLRYMQALHVQVSQTAVCNNHHTLEERLTRWLLMAHDRAGEDQFPMTHEFTYGGAEISFSIRVDTTLLSLDQAVPFALIVNELVTNALVHAFEADGCGSIQVSLRHSPPGRIELTVADDRIGIPAELLKPGKGGTGLNLVRALAKQLGGSLEIDPFPGTTFRIAFRDPAAGTMPS
jgi:signal transduction histidine kinase